VASPWMRLKRRVKIPAAGTWHNKVGSMAVPAGLLSVEHVAEMKETGDRQGALGVILISPRRPARR
jgi:hypothetical protein